MSQERERHNALHAHYSVVAKSGDIKDLKKSGKSDCYVFKNTLQPIDS